MMGGQCIDMLSMWDGVRGIAERRQRERPEEVGLHPFERGGRGPLQALRVQRSLQGLFEVPSQDAGLQLACPVPARSKRQALIAGQMAFELGFLELSAV